MRKEKTRKITSWYQLLEFVEGMNPNVETIALTGFINRIVGDRAYIDTLYFTTKPVQVIKEKFENGKNGTIKKTKRKTCSKTME